MNTRRRPLLEGQPEGPNGLRTATEPSVPTTDGGPKVVARQGVLSSLRPDPRPPTPPGPVRQVVVSWLRVTCPDRRGGTPTAESWCRCGWHRTAAGRTNVMRLQTLHAHHRNTCPLTHPTTEGRPAA